MRTTIDLDQDVEKLLKNYLSLYKKFNCHANKSSTINTVCRETLPNLIERLTPGKEKEWTLSRIKELQLSLKIFKNPDQRIKFISELGKLQINAYSKKFIDKIETLPML